MRQPRSDTVLPPIKPVKERSTGFQNPFFLFKETPPAATTTAAPSVEALRASSDHLVPRSESFEVFGFDVIVDEAVRR